MNAKRVYTLVLILSLALGLSPGPYLALAAPRTETVPAPEVQALPADGDTTQVDGLPEGVSADWWAQAQRYIEGSEYEITWQEPTYLPDIPGAYQAPNRAQGFRTYFLADQGSAGTSSAGIRVISRTEITPTWQLGLALTGYGYANGVQPVPGAALRVGGNRVEYMYADLTGLGNLSGLGEWYVNDERGLEQGFVLQPVGPDGGALPETYVLDLTVDGNLTPVLAADGAGGEFSAPDGRQVLRYGDVLAVDAAGQPVPVELALLPEGTTGGATIRLTLPPFTQPVTLTARLTAPLVSANASEDLLTFHPDWTYKNDKQDAHEGDQFGHSVSTAGDVNGDGYGDIIVGAPYFDAPEGDRGKVYLWYGSSDGLGTSHRAPDWEWVGERGGDRFGYSVGTAGDVNGDGYADVLVGAVYYNNGQPCEGAVYVFYGGAGGLHKDDWWRYESNRVNTDLGTSVSTAEDVNGDGYDDVIVGAPWYESGQTDEGAVYLWYGSAVGMGAAQREPDWKYESDQTSALFGYSVGTAGDVDGDGYGDIIVGAYLYDESGGDRGKVYLWYGSSDGLGLSQRPADWSKVGGRAGEWFGQAVGTAGDVNADGYADIVVGARYYNYGQVYEGAVYVFYGTKRGDGGAGIQDSWWRYESNQGGTDLGGSVSTAGDVNGDGYSDVIVGAPRFTNGQTNEGRAYVYLGAKAGLSNSPAWTAESDRTQAFLGHAVGTAGDVNGDGYSDVIVGAYQFQHGDTWRDVLGGAAFVWYGSAAGLGANGEPTNAGWAAYGDQAYAQFGYAVGEAGDVNGDGYGDVIVGAPAYNNGPAYEGRIFVYYGSAGGPSVTPRWTAEGNQAGAAFGTSVAAAGDITGDGLADVIVGAPYYDHLELASTQEDVGLVRVYHGNGGSALSLRPRQMQVGAMIPIAPLGLSDSETDVRLCLTGRTPMGRERVKLQWQVAPLGTPFTAAPAISGTSAWIDTGVTDVDIVQRVTGLTPGTPYHWRARLLYSGNRLGLGAGRWTSLSWNGWGETDFRTATRSEEPHRVYVPTVLR